MKSYIVQLDFSAAVDKVSHIDRRVLMAEVSGGRVWGKPRLGLMDGVKVALGSREMTVEAARQCAKDEERVESSSAFVDH